MHDLSHRMAWAAALLVVATLATAAPAREATDLEGVDLEALAEAGTLAHGLGRYDFAVQAFEQAYALTMRDDLLLAAGRAHEARYRRDGDAWALSQAVAHYRRYLAVGGREHADVSRALAELEARLALGPDDAPAAPQTAETRLVVMTDALHATIRIDGGKPVRAPHLGRIAAGNHRLELRAPGYRSQSRSLTLPAGRLTAVKIALAPLPARLQVLAASDAEIRIDGKLLAVAPLEAPLELDPGRHALAVTLTGFAPHRQTIALERGALTTLSVDLHATDQRIAAWSLLGSGWAALAAGIGLGVASVVAHREARDLLSGGGDDDPGLERVQRANELFDTRDDFRVGSGIAGGAGLALLLVGGGLFILDEPDVAISPGVGGGALELRF